MCSECRAPPLRRSRSSAFSFRSRTAARRNVQTLIGSYVALSTRTLAMPAGNCRARGDCSSSSQGIGAEDSDRIGLVAQLHDRLGNGGIVRFALEVAEEHVAPQALAQRPRLDPAEVDPTARELAERVDQRPRMVGPQLGE